MYIIKNMEFYVRISDAVEDDEDNTAKKVEYVSMDKATQFDSMTDAVLEAEAMRISGFTIEKT